jgi:hypothetical protein
MQDQSVLGFLVLKNGQVGSHTYGWPLYVYAVWKAVMEMFSL